MAPHSTASSGSLEHEEKVGHDVRPCTGIELLANRLLQELQLLHPHGTVDGHAQHAAADTDGACVLGDSGADGFLPVWPYGVLPQALAHRKPVEKGAENVADTLRRGAGRRHGCTISLAERLVDCKKIPFVSAVVVRALTHKIWWCIIPLHTR